jgi:CRISPR/Cas system endoribonuclease Cas6 (RAMP superfamily)
MKQNKLSRNQNQKLVGTPPPTPVVPMSQNEIDFTPSPDEVARRAYFAYENKGSLQGHEVQHWLAAEAELIAERQLTRTHGFQHHPHKNSPTNHAETIIL